RGAASARAARTGRTNAWRTIQRARVSRRHFARGAPASRCVGGQGTSVARDEATVMGEPRQATSKKRRCVPMRAQPSLPSRPACYSSLPLTREETLLLCASGSRRSTQSMNDTSTTAQQAKLPRQIPYIIGNEGCERFSFYGMRNILTPFLVSSLLLYAPEAERAGIAKDVFHTFVIGVYFFPLLGGWLADRFFGKYQTVFWMSIIYCIGHACLAAFEDNRTGFYTGLFLIAFGSGGIKPLVVSFVGDQFDQTNKHLAKIVFDAFYWIINFGSFFASLLMPIFLREFGASVAFGIPGLLML